MLCDPRDHVTPSENARLWLATDTGLASVSAPKFVNERVGGPKLIGSRDAPTIPSCPATSSPYAKYGSVLLVFRLNVTRALLTARALSVWLHDRSVFHPEPDVSSMNPNV